MSTTTTLSELMQTYHDKLFLERAMEMMTYDVGAVKKAMPANSGKTVRFTRLAPLAKATTALTESTNPSFVTPTATNIDVTVAEYGNAIRVSSLFDLTAIDEGLNEHIEIIAQNAGETLDELIKTELSGNVTEQFAAGAATEDAVTATDTLDGLEIRTSVRQLKLNKAPKFENGMYRSIVPVSCVHDLRGDSEWLDAHRYVGNADALRSDMIGTLHGVEFHETNNEEINTDGGSGTVDTYSTFVFGRGAYGIVDVAGSAAPKVIVKNPSAGDTSNALDMYSTVGWKVTFAAKVLNADWCIEILAASSVGAN